MADNQNIPNPSSAHNDFEARFHWFRQEFLPQHGSKILIVIAVVVAAFIGYLQYQSKAQAAELALNETLGQGLDQMARGKADSAVASFESLLANPKASSLQKAKGALLLGSIKFQRNDMDGAAQAFTTAKDNAGEVVLLKSGAEHGLATISMEKKDYAKAAEQLEAFVKTYGKRSGNLEDRYAKTEPVDEITTVPDALWKLTLCYNALQKNDQAKASADRILKIYASSREAALAKKFLATL